MYRDATVRERFCAGDRHSRFAVGPLPYGRGSEKPSHTRSEPYNMALTASMRLWAETVKLSHSVWDERRLQRSKCLFTNAKIAAFCARALSKSVLMRWRHSMPSASIFFFR